MRLAALIALLLLGCSAGTHPGWLMQANADGTAVVYSERFEHVDRIAAERVGLLFAITLAPDRLPASADGTVTEVRTLEFINLSGAPVTIALQSLNLRGITLALKPTEITLAPRATAAIEPSVGRGSVYQRREQDFRLRYRYDDNLLEVAGTADRLTVRELEERTQAGLAWRFK